MPLLAVDMSNYTSQLTPDSVQALKDAGVGHVIVQAIDPPAGYPAGVTRQQVQACAVLGLSVDAYVWLWFDADISDILHKLSLLDGLPIRQLWLDVEDTAAIKYDQATCEAKVQAALDACDGWQIARGAMVSPGINGDAQRPLNPTGVYSGRWFWSDRRYMVDTTAFSDRELWDSNYDAQPDTQVNFRPYGGWTIDQLRIKQYQGTSTLAGVSGLDLNVLSVAEEGELHAPPEPAPEPQPDDEDPRDKRIFDLQTALGDVTGADGEIRVYMKGLVGMAPNTLFSQSLIGIDRRLDEIHQQFLEQ